MSGRDRVQSYDSTGDEYYEDENYDEEGGDFSEDVDANYEGEEYPDDVTALGLAFYRDDDHDG